MRLLVSVANREEAVAALAGGADIIDAKDPTTGPLGAVSMAVLREIHAASGTTRPVTAALGDADDERAIEREACARAAAGATLVKVGFAGIAGVERAAALLAAAVRGATGGSGGRCGVIAVAYADAHRVASLAPGVLTEAAATVGAAGVLLDTADKDGPGLRALFSPGALAAWVAQAHEARLLVALAGRLQIDDLGFVRDAGADVAGVRGAACEGGRTGRVTAAKVRGLRRIMSRSG
jgi:(5-formylfuran-3-yl)methyl phosphate synthase